MATAPQTAAQTPAASQPPVLHSTFPVEDVMDVCAQYSSMLHVPAGVDGRKIMAAIAAVESGGGDIRYVGHNCGPRHEPAYDVNGAVWRHSTQQQALVKQYGSAAAASYGPWQTMFINSSGCSPEELLTDLDKCAQAFVAQFNSYVENVRHAATVEEIGDVWNLGHIGPDPAYTDKLAAAYAALE